MPKGVYERQNDETRFWKKVDKDGPRIPYVTGQCWMWYGTRVRNGYGIFKWAGKPGLAHRYSYWLHYATLPDDMNVCHRCDNPSCVNPSHLWLGTNRDNAKDRDMKQRQIPRRGEDFTHAKLTDDIVRYIRLNYVPFCSTHGTRAMARKFGVSHMLVRQVLHGRIWRHIEPITALRASTTRVGIASRQ